MDYKQIQLSPEMNKSAKENLLLRGDSISLYAVKYIEELESNKLAKTKLFSADDIVRIINENTVLDAKNFISYFK